MYNCLLLFFVKFVLILSYWFIVFFEKIPRLLTQGCCVSFLRLYFALMDAVKSSENCLQHNFKVVYIFIIIKQ